MGETRDICKILAKNTDVTVFANKQVEM